MIVIAEQEGAFLGFHVALLDGIGGAPAFVGLIAGADIAHFNGNERPTLAGLHDLGLENGVLAAVMLKNITGTNQISVDFHGTIRGLSEIQARNLTGRHPEGKPAGQRIPTVPSLAGRGWTGSDAPWRSFDDLQCAPEMEGKRRNSHVERFHSYG